MGNITRKAPVHRERHEWSWLEFSDRLEFEMRPVNGLDGEGLYELIILVGPLGKLASVLSNFFIIEFGETESHGV